MCLALCKYPIKEIANENIECYKILEKHEFFWWFFKYKTAIQNYSIRLGEKYKSEIEFGSDYFFYKDGTRRYNTVEKGLHSFTNLEDAIKFCKNQFKNISKNYVIVKCYIPKYEEYYNGKFNEYDAYASKKLQYTKEILHDTTELHNKINAFFDEILKS